MLKVVCIVGSPARSLDDRSDANALRITVAIDGYIELARLAGDRSDGRGSMDSNSLVLLDLFELFRKINLLEFRVGRGVTKDLAKFATPTTKLRFLLDKNNLVAGFGGVLRPSSQRVRLR